MATLREIKNRIQAVTNTKKITKTMEMISAAKAKRAVDKVQAAQPYANKINELIKSISSLNVDADHPLLRNPEETKRVGMLVITANRGLCGGFNNNVIRLAVKNIREYQEKGVEVEVHLVGKKSISVFKFQNREFKEGYTHIEDRPALKDSNELANYFMSHFESGHFDGVDIVSTQYLTATRQVANSQQVLPLSFEVEEDGAAANQAALFEPDAATILTSLLPRAIRVVYYQAFLDSSASEHIARRVAMKNATDAASDMIKDMTREYNRARQAKITQEISEIVAGADAIS